jgi:redox-sensitive bicupin YhaK (pirin superfamily)
VGVNDVILEKLPLGFPWATVDPFLFCVHHRDAYPAGNEQMGPAASLEGRRIGQDFEGEDGWRMYHGDVVPGFPQHPHRGFETVTIVRSGYIDHSDSLGATARFGPGDVQWLTAGGGIVHCEMFPLLSKDQPNPVELFQIWLNLPKDDKLVAPHFTMLWSDQIPRRAFTDAANRRTEVTVVAGSLDEARPPSPPPRSWASRPDSGVAIWSIRMDPKGEWTVPPASRADAVRTLYFFGGATLSIGGDVQREHAAFVVRSDRPVRLEAGDDAVDILVLQGRPVGEPVTQYGPFVMNTEAEIHQAMLDYRRTQFGGWPWPSDAPVHPREETRFAKHADGRVERVAR